MTKPRSKWKGTMTDRDRFNAQLHFRPVDRSFNMEFGYWEENYGQWNIFRENGIRSEAEANAFFGFDRLETVRPNIWMYPPFEERVLEVTDGKKILINADGLLAEVPEDGHDTIPHFIKASISTPDDWKRCKEERFGRDDPDRMPDVDALKKQYPDDRDYPLGIECGSMIGKIRDLLTFEGLTYAWFDYPEMVEDMVETSCLLVEDALDRLLPHFRFDFASGWEDICYKGGPLVTLDLFTNVVVPRYKRISEKLHRFGVDLWYTDCDGDVRPLLPYFLESGINCLFPFEVNSCTHPGRLLDEYRGALRIMGGVDKLKLIEGKTAIREYLESLLPYVERGGYIPFCDHRCPPDVSPENYLYYLDLKERMFGGGMRP